MVTITESVFGAYTDMNTGKDIPIRLFTLKNSQMYVQVMAYGATITAIKMPDKNGYISDVLLGFGSIVEYRSRMNFACGATIGRVANRLCSSKFKCEGNIITVSSNESSHHFNGGFIGFDKVLWEAFVYEKKLVLSYHCKDLEEGFPGDLVVHAIFQLTENNEFTVEYTAVTTKPTYVNITNRPFLNLGGYWSGAAELYKHVISINGDQIIHTDPEGIPTGVLSYVGDTMHDLQKPSFLYPLIKYVKPFHSTQIGFDHLYRLNKSVPEEIGSDFVARVEHPENGRVVEIFSNQPVVQFLTMNWLPEDSRPYKPAEPVIARKTCFFYKHCGLCLEPQNWPDAPNQLFVAEKCLLPGETYNHRITYKFSVKDE